MIAFVILNYNTPYHTLKCLNSIYETYQNNKLVVIVDNKSTDDSIKILSNELSDHSNVRLIINNENYGYAKGNNIGIENVLKENNIECIMVVNSDVVFLPKTISEMEKYIQVTSDCAVVVPATLDKNGNDNTLIRRKVDTFLKLIVSTTFLNRIFPHKFNKLIIKTYDKTEPMMIEVISGCCLLFKIEILKNGKLFDENTFLYAEEFILERELSNNQYKSYIIPFVKVIHYHGESTKKFKLFSFIKSIESHMYYGYNYLNLNRFQLRLYIIIYFISFIKMTIFRRYFFKNFIIFHREINIKKLKRRDLK